MRKGTWNPRTVKFRAGDYRREMKYRGLIKTFAKAGKGAKMCTHQGTPTTTGVSNN